MKIKKFLLIAFFSILNTMAFAEEYTQEEIENKIAGFTKMKNAGTGMIIAGSIVGGCCTGLYIAGLVKMIDDGYFDLNNPPSNSIPDGFGQYLGGAVGMGIGFTVLAGGIVFSSIGRKKVSKYKQKLAFAFTGNSLKILVSF